MENKIIKNRISSLRSLMKENNIDAYLVVTSDYHDSEWVSDYFKEREFITGFTGSNGNALIMQDIAILWTDGRYFLQAEDQLNGTGVELYKMGEEGVPTLIQFLTNNSKTIKTLAFDGRTVNYQYYQMIEKALPNSVVKIDIDLIEKIWDNRPQIPSNKVFELDIKFAGITRKEKIEIIKKHIVSLNADSYVVSSLDDIAWILNLRGSDIECNPVFLSYLLFNKDEVILYVQDNAIDSKLLTNLNKDGITVKSYLDIYKDLSNLHNVEGLVLNKRKLNSALCELVKDYNLIDEMDYSTKLKAVKNDCEIKNAYLAHKKDGIALVKFLYWIKTQVDVKTLTEIKVSDYLEDLRKQNENFVELSFLTIAGYKEHGAIIHYEPTPETDIPLNNESFLLLDSGAQYLEGTTDVTRTISLGKLTDEEKRMYTLVLKSHIALGNAVFRRGVSGGMLDMLARDILWKNNLDYNHGTGHGVGSFLNVHEGPQNISASPLRASYPFEEGMITSNEPGLYFENKFGVRIENLILCIKDKKNEFGDFLKFDTLTLCPYEVEAIDKSMLTSEEINTIHSYHERIYNELKDSLTIDEASWLKKIVEAI